MSIRKSLTLLLVSSVGTLGVLGCDEDTAPNVSFDAALPKGDGAVADGAASDATSGGNDAGTDAEATDDAATDAAETDGSAPADASPSANAPTVLVELPEAVCNTPDGMRMDKNGNLILSCPNFFSKTDTDAGTVYAAAPALMKITPQNTLEPYFTNLPAPPNAPNRAGPMGIDFGPDGNLYVADHQYRYDITYKSRVLRVNVDPSGNPTTADVVVEGIRLANAVMWNKDFLYVTDTWAYDVPAEGGKSAIYRFSKAELAAATTANPIRIQKPTATTADPHLFAQLMTEAGRGVNLAGADGVTFDGDGNLITGNFGDGVITKITFDGAGNKATQTIWVKDPNLTCADGIFYDSVSKNIYVTDSQKNAIKVISPAGTVSTLWENDDSNGTGGLLDQPAEPTIRGGDLIIANFDAGFTAMQPGKNKTHEPPFGISVIKLR